MKNNYLIILKENQVNIATIDIIINSETEECECEFTNDLLVLQVIDDDGNKRDIYINPEYIVAIVPKENE